MNPQRRVEGEFAEASSSSHTGMLLSKAAPQPMEGLHDVGPTPFLSKTYDIVEDCNTNHIISWSRGNNSFVVWDPPTFSMILLPRYFKHNNFSSFLRQLNTYGFSKVDPEMWEFANEGFLRGQKHLLKHIRRRKTAQPQLASQQALDLCVDAGRFGSVDGKADRLRGYKQLLMVELLKLRQQQQNTRRYLQAMEQRLGRTEVKQQQMASFLARAMKNPNFVQQLVQQKDMRKEESRRREILSEFEVFDVLEKLGMEMQGVSESQKIPEEACMEERRDEAAEIKDEHPVFEGFWENFFDEEDIQKTGW